MPTESTLSSAGTPAIEVLLATYNGERFLRQQIDSILAQTYPNVTILASDDGSLDGTVAILQAYEERFPGRVRMLPGSAGTAHPKWNFMRLMQASTAPYVALSDQDDVWVPEKLAMSMAAMQSEEQRRGATTPVLVFTDAELVDENLQPLHPSFWQKQGIPGEETERLPRLLAQNVYTGCTGLLNRPLVERSLPIPQKAHMHDWWIMLVAAVFGRLVSIPHATVRYRQHGSNAVGAAEDIAYGLVPRFREHKLRRFEWEMTERQAEALLEQFGDALPRDKRATIEAYVRCETSPYRVVRVATLLRHGFLRKALRMNLGMLWYLWDMKAAKREQL